MIGRFHYMRCNGCAALLGKDLYLSAAEARKAAKAAGWLRVPKRRPSEGGSPGADYCPTCSATPTTERP